MTYQKELVSTCSEREEEKFTHSPKDPHNIQYTDMDILEIKVRKEIEEKGLDFVLDKALLGEDTRTHKRKQYVQDRQKKTKTQIKVLTHELAKVLKRGKRMTRSRRARIGKKIGLTENQVYKWYYDNVKGESYDIKLDKFDCDSNYSY